MSSQLLWKNRSTKVFCSIIVYPNWTLWTILTHYKKQCCFSEATECYQCRLKDSTQKRKRAHKSVLDYVFWEESAKTGASNWFSVGVEGGLFVPDRLMQAMLVMSAPGTELPVRCNGLIKPYTLLEIWWATLTSKECEEKRSPMSSSRNVSIWFCSTTARRSRQLKPIFTNFRNLIFFHFYKIY